MLFLFPLTKLIGLSLSDTAYYGVQISLVKTVLFKGYLGHAANKFQNCQVTTQVGSTIIVKSALFWERAGHINNEIIYPKAVM